MEENKWKEAVMEEYEKLQNAIDNAPEGADLTKLDAQVMVLKGIILKVG